MLQVAAVGIDLGTTYSSVAVVSDQGTPEIIPNSLSERLTPSAVLFEEDTIVVGQTAKDSVVDNPDNAILFIKRQIGNPNWHFSYQGQQYSPVDVSALILKKLREDAAIHLNRHVDYAVITVPAYFDDDRRRMTRIAGEIAGFKVLALLNEPTAAAIAFGVERSSEDEIVLVYDLGGGTFDVTLMRVNGKDIQIIATDGDHQLGGKDFDDAIIRFAVDRFETEHGFDPTLDPFVAEELRVKAEKAKRDLSERGKTVLMLRAEGKVTRLEITREEFSNLIRPKIDTTLSLVRSVLRDAKLQPDQIDRILLIGGSTRVIAVREQLKNYFDKEPDSSVNPNEAVALGAALMAAKRLAELDPDEVAPLVIEKVGGLQITDVTSHSLGIEATIPGTSQKINSILISRNSPIPTEVSKEFVTTIQGQTAIKVTIYQGEFEDTTLCKAVGEFTLTGLPQDRPPGQKVRITISCGIDGVVSVTALDIATGKETMTDVNYTVGQTEQKNVSAKARWLESRTIS